MLKKIKYVFLLLNLSFVCTVHADLISFLKNSAQSKEVWLGAAIATTAWGVHKLYADKFSGSLHEEISYKSSEIDGYMVTERFINAHINPNILANVESYSFKGSDGKTLELDLLKESLDIRTLPAIEFIGITEKPYGNKTKKITFLKTLDNKWQYTEIEQTKTTQMALRHDQIKANRFHLARNIGIGTGLGISLWGAYLHSK
ncbi:hypothetical protein HYX58_04350 [Candidatus Dependentiae bacterium]|nr:hypothetical protein [Candidatus Dependentiae bacterium]